MPYPSKRRRFSASNMNENDATFHDSFKPSFSGHNALVYSVPGSAPQLSGDMKEAIKPLVSQGRNIRFAKFTALEDIDSQSLELQKQHTELQQRDDEQTEVPQQISHSPGSHRPRMATHLLRYRRRQFGSSVRSSSTHLMYALAISSTE